MVHQSRDQVIERETPSVGGGLRQDREIVALLRLGPRRRGSRRQGGPGFGDEVVARGPVRDFQHVDRQMRVVLLAGLVPHRGRIGIDDAEPAAGLFDLRLALLGVHLGRRRLRLRPMGSLGPARIVGGPPLGAAVDPHVGRQGEGTPPGRQVGIEGDGLEMRDEFRRLVEVRVRTLRRRPVVAQVMVGRPGEADVVGQAEGLQPRRDGRRGRGARAGLRRSMRHGGSGDGRGDRRSQRLGDAMGFEGIRHGELHVMGELTQQGLVHHVPMGTFGIDPAAKLGVGMIIDRCSGRGHGAR